MRKINRLIVALVAILSLAGCAKGSSNHHTLTLNLAGEPTVLNPILSTDTGSSMVEGFIFNGLVKVDENLKFEPDLAESYTISPDGLVYTFHLKKNVKWQDGQPFTAADVKFTFDALLDPKTKTVRRSNYEIDGKPMVFKAPDPYTFQAILPKPFAPALVNLATEILPKHLLDGQDINTATFNRQPVGTGPFKLDKWQSGTFLKLVRNPGYFGDKPKLNSVVLKIIPNDVTALAAFERGELDMVSVPIKDIPRISQEPHVKILRYYPLQYDYLSFNLKNEQFKDVRVRQAIALAIDKPALVKGVLQGYGIQVDIPESPSMWTFPKKLDFKPYTYQPEEAKKQLAALGYRPGDDGILVKNGKRFEFTVLTRAGNKDREKAAQIIQKYLADVGIKMNIQSMEWGAMLQRVNAPTDPKPFDAVILGWFSGIEPDSYSIWHSSQYPNGFNFIGYSNPKVDAALSKARTTVNRDSRKKIYQSIYTELGQEVPYIFLYVPEAVTAVRDGVSGLSKPGPAGLMVHIENVDVE